MPDNEKRPLRERLYECLGQIVTNRRKRLGMSQEELADAAGIDRAFLSKIEGGKKQPSFGLVADIAQGLRMRYARLVQNCEECVGNEKSA
jgi:transcriptional regulator with XRE-family HTH domain